MSKKRKKIEQVGAALVEASKHQTVDSIPLSTKLFPYIYIAQRRMSTRKISQWLQETHGVSLSAAMICRSLNSEEAQLGKLAEIIGPMARYVGHVYGLDPMDLLLGEEFPDGPTMLSKLSTDHPQPRHEDDIPRWKALQELLEAWEPIPHEVKLMMRPYLEDHLEPEDPTDPENIF